MADQTPFQKVTKCNPSISAPQCEHLKKRAAFSATCSSPELTSETSLRARVATPPPGSLLGARTDRSRLVNNEAAPTLSGSRRPSYAAGTMACIFVMHLELSCEVREMAADVAVFDAKALGISSMASRSEFRLRSVRSPMSRS